MRGGGRHSEPLVMLGYSLGMVVTLFVRQWAPSDGGGVLDQLLAMCQVLFAVAFLIGLAGLLFRAVRRLVRLVARRDEPA